MSFIKKIKQKYHQNFLKRELSITSRKKQVMGFDEAIRIGVLFDASDQESFEVSIDLIRELEAAGKKVIAMGFNDRKNPGEYLLESINVGFFHPKDFSWNLKRRNNRLQDFESSTFDILIDLTPPELSLTKYIAGVSKAKYKVGAFHESNVDLFDLMIRLSGSFRLQELVQHSLFYLKMIKKPVSHVGAV